MRKFADLAMTSLFGFSLGSAVFGVSTTLYGSVVSMFGLLMLMFTPNTRIAQCEIWGAIDRYRFVAAFFGGLSYIMVTTANYDHATIYAMCFVFYWSANIFYRGMVKTANPYNESEVKWKN